MNASLLAVLNDAERLLVAGTDRTGLAGLDEDAAIELEARIRRARNKYVGQYRRAASAAVPEHGGRGRARPQNKQAAMKAEAFEEALSRVSRRVATLARQAAAELRAERLAAARAAKQGRGPGGRAAAPAASRKGRTVTGEPTGDRALRSPRSEEQRAGTLAMGARAGQTGQPVTAGRAIRPVPQHPARDRVTNQARPARSPSPATGLVTGLARLGPYFAVETHHARARIRQPWQPLSSLLSSPQALTARITDVRAALAAAADRPPEQIEFRVAASVTHLGLAARLISPALASAVLDISLRVDPAEAWWAPALGGPFRLSLPDAAFGSAAARSETPADDNIRESLRSLLRGPICSLVEMTAAMATSRRVLWGNVSSAINGAAAMISAAQPALTAGAAATASAMLGFPALAGVYHGQPVTTFRRRNCCLIYRIASPPANEYCGDCILSARTVRHSGG